MYISTVSVDGEQLFILVDVEYMMNIKEYVESIYENILDPNKNETMYWAVAAFKQVKEETKKPVVRESDEHMIERPFKLCGNMSNLTIALLNPRQSDQPQVVMLQVIRLNNLFIVIIL